MYSEKEIFSRCELLIGSEAMNKLKRTRVILFGTGGVGSWCAESLIRSGIGCLTIVDSDKISVSNINRQLPATTETVGDIKTETLKKRLETINPYAEITALQDIYSAETADSFHLNRFDYIIDAIDSLQHKAHLIITATQTNAAFFSSMGAALKLNPTRIQTAEFWKVRGCPLAAALRRRFKKQNIFPAKKFRCVYSDEVLAMAEASVSLKSSTQQPPISDETSSSLPHTAAASVWDTRKAQINGTIAHIPAIFGFTLAGLVIQDALRRP
jgi:tRNA A37 threonylcarbamoyladenosine dehydratase